MNLSKIYELEREAQAHAAAYQEAKSQIRTVIHSTLQDPVIFERWAKQQHWKLSFSKSRISGSGYTSISWNTQLGSQRLHLIAAKNIYSEMWLRWRYQNLKGREEGGEKIITILSKCLTTTQAQLLTRVALQGNTLARKIMQVKEGGTNG